MSDTPETDAIVGRHQKEIADLPMNPPIEVALRLSQNHCLALMSLAQSAERERDALKAENDMLRGLLGNSAKPCAYCGLPAEDQAKCPHGFPGCARADDQMLSKHFADGYRADEAEKEIVKLKAELAADRERIDWIADNLFEHHWDGTIGRPSYWQIWSGYRHVTIKMIGNSFREAVDAARKP